MFPFLFQLFVYKLSELTDRQFMAAYRAEDPGSSRHPKFHAYLNKCNELISRFVCPVNIMKKEA